jgi:calpain-7
MKPTSFELMTISQDIGTRAAKLELAGSFDSAFEHYVKAAQIYVYLIRHCQDPTRKEQLRSVSNKLVERATKIKQTKKDLKPVQRSWMDTGQ